MSATKIIDRGGCEKNIEMPYGLCSCIPFCATDKEGKPIDLSNKHVRIAFFDKLTGAFKPSGTAYIHQQSSGNMPGTFVYEAYFADDMDFVNGKGYFPMWCGIIPGRGGSLSNDSSNRNALEIGKCCYRILCIDRQDTDNITESLICYGEICFTDTTTCC